MFLHQCYQNSLDSGVYFFLFLWVYNRCHPSTAVGSLTSGFPSPLHSVVSSSHPRRKTLGLGTSPTTYPRYLYFQPGNVVPDLVLFYTVGDLYSRLRAYPTTLIRTHREWGREAKGWFRRINDLGRPSLIRTFNPLR